VDNPEYGSISPKSVLSDNSGKAKSTFKVNQTSGVVNITARISADGFTVIRYINVNIDHDTPYYPYFEHPLAGTVATDVPFNISITDRWGNRIDDRRGSHIISLHVHGPAPDDCGFILANTSQHDISSILDANGNISHNVRLTTKVGPNNILMDAFGNIPDKLEWINADTTGIPFSISQEYFPSGSPPSLPADGTSIFTIKYSLLDRYANPAGQQWVWVNTSLIGEENKFKSNNLGQITITYGPKSSIGAVNITATTVANSTVKISQPVEFTNTAASNMELTANPESMASRDVNPLITSDITATVTDALGNPVKNEIVYFSLGTVGYPGGPYNVTSLPNLANNSSTTDDNGFATVQFIPGSFNTNSSSLYYSPYATGNVTVTATWNSSPKHLLVTWKNYPYLSVKTSVLPPIVAQNDTVEVTIDLKGDGWALAPSPVDTVLIIDRSGSMGGDTPTRISQAKSSAKTFVDQMNSSRDRVGLVSFSSSTSLDQSLTNNFGGVKTKIDTMSASGATQLRNAAYTGIKNVATNGRSNAVKAIILVTDGEWNYDGTPLGAGNGFNGSTATWPGNAVSFSSYQYYSDLGGGSYLKSSVPVPNGGNYWDAARGTYVSSTTNSNVWHYENAGNTAQNLSVYAKNNGIRIYAITFAYQPVTECTDALRIMANSTGGFYAHAPNGATLTQLYAKIAGDLKDTAGVNTTMVVDNQNINVTGVPLPGAQVFSYISHPTFSTRIGWQDGVINVTNQSADWAADSKLDFTVGTIKIGQIWNATYRMKANRSGSIDVFGTNSLLSFNGGSSSLTLPHTFLTVVPQLNVTSTGQKTLNLENLLITEPGEIKTVLPVMWNTTYTGNKTITEQIYYSVDNGPWVKFSELTHGYPYAPDIVSSTEYVDYAQLDVRKLPPGGYKIKVYATASDAPDDELITDAKRVGGAGKTYIKLEAPPFEIFELPWSGTSISHYFK
jgi:hypothetical protein